MSDYLKDVINQIIEIDSMAFNNKTKNEQVLSDKKLEYENLIASYREEKLSEARKKTQNIAEETDAIIKKNGQELLEQVKTTSAKIEKIYQESEKDLTKKIFNKLFVLEG